MRTGHVPSWEFATRRPRWDVVVVYLMALFFGAIFWLLVARLAVGFLSA